MGVCGPLPAHQPPTPEPRAAAGLRRGAPGCNAVRSAEVRHELIFVQAWAPADQSSPAPAPLLAVADLPLLNCLRYKSHQSSLSRQQQCIGWLGVSGVDGPQL